MKFRTSLCLATLVTLAASSYPHAQAASIDDFFHTFTDEWMRMNPNAATSARYFTGAEQDALETEMTPLTREWRQRRAALARRGLADLKTFERARLTPAQRVSADLMQWQLAIAADGEKFEDFTFPLEQFAGANIDLPNALTVVHPLNTEKDAANYVKRLGQVSTRMDEAIAEASRLARKGMVPPRFIIRATIVQMQQFISTPAAGNPLVTSFTERISPTVPAATRDALRADVEGITAAQVYPAWRRAIALLEPLVAKTTDEAGLSRFKGGDEAYRFALRRFTTTDLTADQIHEVGLREVARIEKEMDAILRRLGRTDGSVKARIAQLEKDQAYPITEEGRTQIMAEVNRILADAQQRSMALFDRVPRAAVVARPYPRFRENNAAASYNSPSRDGSRP